MMNDLSAEHFIQRLEAHRSPEEQAQREATQDRYGEGDVFMGARMGHIFALGKEFMNMPPGEIDKLLDSPVYELRAGAMSIMGHQAMHKKTPESRKKELFDLYLRRMDRINSWQLVDISCHKVLGGYLLDKPRDILYQLARSENWCERRAAIYTPLLFIRDGDLDDAFKLSEMLLHDDHHFIHTAVGGVLRDAGKQDRACLLRILDQYAATMPRIMLRFAIEHLDQEQRTHYLSMKTQAG